MIDDQGRHYQFEGFDAGNEASIRFDWIWADPDHHLNPFEPREP